MSQIRRQSRLLRLLLAGFVLLAACSPPPAIYSRNPVDDAGQRLDQHTLIGLELRDHTRYELDEGETLQIEAGVLVLRSRVRTDGSRRQRVFDLGEVELLKVRREDGQENWYPVATPMDLLEFDVLPRLETITMNDGELIELDRDMKTRWSASHLEILVGPEGTEDRDLRSLPLDEIESIHIADANPLRATLLSPKFWIVAGVAVGLGWFIAGREDSDNTAVE
jgi:hypothetical protein